MKNLIKKLLVTFASLALAISLCGMTLVSAAEKTSIEDLTITITNKVYTGKNVNPVTITDGDKTLKLNTDYKISGSRKKPGTHTITITGKGSYTGTVKKQFNITPKKAKLKTPSKTKTSITAKWYKVSYASGYEVSYRESGSEEWTSVNVSYKKRSKKFSGLTEGVTYEIEVRAYKTSNGEKIYGEYSAIKTVTTAASTSSTKSSSKRSKLVAAAKKKLGKKYKYGASGPNRFDCSGFTMWCYKQIGIKLPHNSTAQKRKGKVISIKSLKAGDIVWRPGHVGLYVGNGKVIHAPHTGARVSYTSAKGFRCGVRIL